RHPEPRDLSYGRSPLAGLVAGWAVPRLQLHDRQRRICAGNKRKWKSRATFRTPRCDCRFLVARRPLSLVHSRQKPVRQAGEHWPGVWCILAIPDPLRKERGNPIKVAATEFNEMHAQVAPDSRWVAYDSDETGRSEIYVRSFPPGDGGAGK